MTPTEVLAELESLGTEQNRKVYRRHGATEPVFGVSFANLGLLKKRIKRDQQLAQGLWDSRIHDAQQLAPMIADPSAFSRRDLDRWVATAANYASADALAKHVVIRTPHACGAATKWIDGKPEATRRAGWATVGCLATYGDGEDEFFLALLPRIERDIHEAPNRARESMNSALIAIGCRSAVLRGPAIEAGRRIGTVHVDQGETYCKTPDAVSYIEKASARKTRPRTA